MTGQITHQAIEREAQVPAQFQNRWVREHQKYTRFAAFEVADDEAAIAILQSHDGVGPCLVALNAQRTESCETWYKTGHYLGLKELWTAPAVVCGDKPTKLVQVRTAITVGDWLQGIPSGASNWSADASTEIAHLPQNRWYDASLDRLIQTIERSLANGGQIEVSEPLVMPSQSTDWTGIFLIEALGLPGWVACGMGNKSVMERIYSLQLCTWRPLRLLRVWETNEKLSDAKRKFQEALRAPRPDKHRDWFQIDASDAIARLDKLTKASGCHIAFGQDSRN